jgi:predicted RecB family nuclease
MKLSESEILSLSASDLTNHLSCKHLTNLNLAESNGEIKKPHYYDPDLEKIIQLGHRHEQAYVQYLRDKGKDVVELRDYEGSTAQQRTISAMQDGADIIVQAYLEDGIWNGRADILQKVSKVSDLGDWSYEVIDTKLARNTKATTVLQLCLYSELVENIQGVLPDKMHVVIPGTGKN